MRLGGTAPLLSLLLLLLLSSSSTLAHEVMDNCNVKDSDGNILFDFTPLFRG